METRPTDSSRPEVAHIGKSVVIKGELSGSEDLYLDGEVEGSVELRNHHLTIGPNGRVRAHIHAHEIVIHGKLDGNVNGDERVELKKTAVLAGDIITRRIVIEDGATFKGSVEVLRETSKTEPRRETAAAGASSGSGASAGFAAAAGTGSAFAKPALAEQKK